MEKNTYLMESSPEQYSISEKEARKRVEKVAAMKDKFNTLTLRLDSGGTYQPVS